MRVVGVIGHALTRNVSALPREPCSATPAVFGRVPSALSGMDHLRYY